MRVAPLQGFSLRLEMGEEYIGMLFLQILQDNTQYTLILRSGL